tara:strand:+ start:171 stop:341 length:171 start_codon:yes stop_codon:yes gene_type:complete
MAKKGKDTRPSRGKQKDRTKANKIKQLEAHVLNNPKDQLGKKKLEKVKSGRVRASQ